MIYRSYKRRAILMNSVTAGQSEATSLRAGKRIQIILHKLIGPHLNRYNLLAVCFKPDDKYAIPDVRVLQQPFIVVHI